MFATDEEFHMLMMHPHMLVCDTTFNMSSMNKELVTLALRDGNNLAHNAARGYIPSSRKWVFDLLFKYVLPTFWGLHIMRQIRLFLTDGDPNEYQSFIHAIGEEIYPNALHHLCYFHLHVQGWIKHVVKFIPKGAKAKAIAEWLRHWIKTWFFDIETEAEYKESKQHFFKYLKDNEDVLTRPCCDVVRKYLLGYLFHYSHLWLNYHYLDVFGLGEKTTSIGEGMHYSTKGLGGAKASMNPSTSVSAMADKAQARGQRIRQQNAAQVDRTKLWSQSDTRDYLTKYAESAAEDLSKLSKRCRAMGISPGFWLVYTPGKFLRMGAVVCCFEYNSVFNIVFDIVFNFIIVVLNTILYLILHSILYLILTLYSISHMTLYSIHDNSLLINWFRECCLLQRRSKQPVSNTTVLSRKGGETFGQSVPFLFLWSPGPASVPLQGSVFPSRQEGQNNVLHEVLLKMPARVWPTQS